MKSYETTYDESQIEVGANCAPIAPESAKTAPSNRVPGKPGPPLGSMNAVRHGLTLPLSTFPPGCRYLERRLKAFKAWLLAELSKLGPIDPRTLPRVDTCCLHVKRGYLAERWLRKDEERSPLDARLRLLEAATEAAESRDAILAELGLKPATGFPEAPLPSYAREVQR